MGVRAHGRAVCRVQSPDSPNRRGPQAKPDSGQYQRHALAAHRREQTLQLSHEIPDEIRVTIHGLDSLNQLSFAMLVEPSTLPATILDAEFFPKERFIGLLVQQYDGDGPFSSCHA